MTPLPKRRISRRRQGKRRAGLRAVFPDVSICPDCHKPKMPHRICLNCLREKNRLENEESKRPKTLRKNKASK